MVNHGAEAEELQAYLDGELEPVRQAEIERHLSACGECAAVLRDLKGVSESLQRWQVEPAPATLRPPKIRGIEPVVRWSPRRLALAFSAGALAVLLVVAVTVPNLLKSRMARSDDLQGLVSPAHSERSTTDAAAPPPPPPAKPEEAERLREKARRAANEGQPSDAAAAEGRLERDYRDEVAKAAPAATAPLMAAQSRLAKEEAQRRLIAYYVTLAVEVKEFGPAKEKLLQAVEKSGGYVSEASTAETPGQPQRASFTLRVPAEKLPALLAELRGLGRVLNEQLSTDEVTEQVVDLEARIRNARATEQRLIAVLNERTGKVRDILEVEREIARTRQEIERMEAQRQNLMHRVELATVQVSLTEEFKAQLAPTPIGTATRLHNAFVAGYEDFVGMFVALALFFARNGLNLLFWGVVLWLTWRRLKPRLLRLVTATQ